MAVWCPSVRKSLAALGLVGLVFMGWGRPGEVHAQPGPAATVVSYSRTEGSLWHLELDASTRNIVANLDDGSQVRLEIDYDPVDDDGHHPGIVPILQGTRYEGLFWGDTAPLIYPILDPEHHRVERLAVEAGTSSLRIRFEGGSYRLLGPAGGDEPLYMEAVFEWVAEGLRVDLAGLYYLLPSQEGTQVEIIDAWKSNSLTVEMEGQAKRTRVFSAGTSEVEVSPQTGHFLKYFDGVTEVRIKDGRFGDIHLATWVQRLQVQVDRHPDVDSELFELDFDHTFKDRGQREVMTRMLLQLPAVEDRREPDGK